MQLTTKYSCNWVKHDFKKSFSFTCLFNIMGGRGSDKMKLFFLFLKKLVEFWKTVLLTITTNLFIEACQDAKILLCSVKKKKKRNNTSVSAILISPTLL